MRDFLSIIKGNIFIIVLLAVVVVAMPWTLIFVLPLLLIMVVAMIFLWRVHRAQKRMYDDVRSQAGEPPHEEESQRWWRRTKREGEVTVVQTEPTEQRVSDDVGEYVDFKEVKNEETK